MSFQNAYYAVIPEAAAVAIAQQYSGLGVDIVNGTLQTGVHANFTSWGAWRMDPDLIWRRYVGAEWDKTLFNFNNPKRKIITDNGGVIFDSELDYKNWLVEHWTVQEFQNENDGYEIEPGGMFDAVTFLTIIY